MSERTITRKTLATYAGLLGRRSIAADALEAYDTMGGSCTIRMTNNGFRILCGAAQVFPAPVPRGWDAV